MQRELLTTGVVTWEDVAYYWDGVGDGMCIFLSSDTSTKLSRAVQLPLRSLFLTDGYGFEKSDWLFDIRLV